MTHYLIDERVSLKPSEWFKKEEPPKSAPKSHEPAEPPHSKWVVKDGVWVPAEGSVHTIGKKTHDGEERKKVMITEVEKHPVKGHVVHWTSHNAPRGEAAEFGSFVHHGKPATASEKLVADLEAELDGDYEEEELLTEALKILHSFSASGGHVYNVGHNATTGKHEVQHLAPEYKGGPLKVVKHRSSHEMNISRGGNKEFDSKDKAVAHAETMSKGSSHYADRGSVYEADGEYEDGLPEPVDEGIFNDLKDRISSAYRSLKGGQEHEVRVTHKEPEHVAKTRPILSAIAKKHAGAEMGAKHGFTSADKIKSDEQGHARYVFKSKTDAHNFKRDVHSSPELLNTVKKAKVLGARKAPPKWADLSKRMAEAVA